MESAASLDVLRLRRLIGAERYLRGVNAVDVQVHANVAVNEDVNADDYVNVNVAG